MLYLNFSSRLLYYNELLVRFSHPTTAYINPHKHIHSQPQLTDLLLNRNHESLHQYVHKSSICPWLKALPRAWRQKETLKEHVTNDFDRVRGDTLSTLYGSWSCYIHEIKRRRTPNLLASQRDNICRHQEGCRNCIFHNQWRGLWTENQKAPDVQLNISLSEEPWGVTEENPVSISNLYWFLLLCRDEADCRTTLTGSTKHWTNHE